MLELFDVQISIYKQAMPKQVINCLGKGNSSVYVCGMK